MSLSEMSDLAEWPVFRRRVRSAMITAAKNVGAEADDEALPERTRLRRALSVNVFLDPDRYERIFALAAASNVALAYDSADDAIQFTVNSVWDAVAGAPPAAEG